jgi:hypothetical protein
VAQRGRVTRPTAQGFAIRHSPSASARPPCWKSGYGSWNARW